MTRSPAGNLEPVNWLGAARDGRLELTLTPPEVLARLQEALPGSSIWERLRLEISGQTFRLWMHRQIPRLQGRVEPLGSGSVVHYDIVTPLGFLVVPALFSAVVLSVPIVAAILQDALAVCGLVLVGPFLAVLWVLVIGFSRVAGREILGRFRRTFEDVEILDALPARGVNRDQEAD